MPDKTIFHILVVEDSASDQILIRECFRDCGHECILIFASTLREAIKRLEEINIHLILLDIRLGSADGLDLVAVVRSNPAIAPTPILVLTGMNGKSEILRAYRAGVNAYLEKTTDLNEACAKVKSLMHFWIKVAQLPETRKK